VVQWFPSLEVLRNRTLQIDIYYYYNYSLDLTGPPAFQGRKTRYSLVSMLISLSKPMPMTYYCSYCCATMPPN